MSVELGPEHVRALNKARNAVLREQRTFENAADNYRRVGHQRSEESMTAEAWACRQVAQYLAELRDSLRVPAEEVTSQNMPHECVAPAPGEGAPESWTCPVCQQTWELWSNGSSETNEITWWYAKEEG